MTSSDEVCAVMASNLSDHGRHHSLRQLSDAWEDNYECNYRVARRAFLSSYHFSEKNGIRDKLRRSVKEMNEVVVGVVSEIRQEICKRRVGIKVFRFTLGLPSMILFRVRCFAPWIGKRRELMQ
ncbi:hypothetical protein OIU77_003007 [Salix suchowensis]|uniref:DUF4817 domain-containing protein n=1 Tax=Salix suchowensis TaxID=1278906 RepID=A0ABQ9AY42_9ROSI|nr:hypothetical protein OIU77_003007 [Salix suchowensis]